MMVMVMTTTMTMVNTKTMSYHNYHVIIRSTVALPWIELPDLDTVMTSAFITPGTYCTHLLFINKA